MSIPEPVQRGPKSVLAVVITYEPDEALFDHLVALRYQVNRIVVVDNGSSIASIVKAVAEEADCIFVGNASNIGVASALNQSLALAVRCEYKWLAMFDQDSLAPAGLISSLLQLAEENPFGERLALVSASHRDRATGMDYHRSGDVLQSLRAGRSVSTAITSGSMVRVKIIEDIGGFDERLFIDGVDLEIALRLRSAGFVLLESKSAVLEHSIGRATRHRLLGRDVTCFNHAPFRRYYITRNQLEISRQYFFRQPAQSLSFLWHLIGNCVVVMIFETDKKAKLFCTLAGLRDFVLRRFGRRR